MLTTTNDLQLSDAALVRRFARKRDQAAFAELVRRYNGLVLGVCQRVLRNQCDVEDAAQATFLVLARKAHRIRKPGSVASWLHGVAFRTATRVRRESRRTEPLPAPDELVGSCQEPFEEIANRHLVEHIDQRLQEIGEKYRAPLILYYFAGQSTQQIAQQLDLTVSAVEGRLKRGRQRLKRGMLSHGLQLPAMMSSILVPQAACSPITIPPKVGVVGAGLSFISRILRTGGSPVLHKTLATIALVAVTATGVAMHTPGRSQSPERQLVTSTSVEVESSDARAVAFIDDQKDDPANMAPTEAFHKHVHDALRDMHNEIFSFYLAVTR